MNVRGWLSKLSILATLGLSSSSVFATGATVTFFSAANPTSVPTLSGTMLVVLSLLLFVVALKISQQKGGRAGKFFVMLLGLGALISGSGGLKLFSDLQASVVAPVIVSGASTYDVPDDGFVFENNSSQLLNFTMQSDRHPNLSSCGFGIEMIAPAIIPIYYPNSAMNHAGQLEVGQFLVISCFSNTTDQPSNIRLKQNVKFLSELRSGLKLYSFNYKQGLGLDSETLYVGVMAQDLLKDDRYRHAVSLKENGYYAVNYVNIGLRMITQDEWQNSNRNVFLKPLEVANNSIITGQF